MIQGYDVLYFSADDWGCGLTTSQTHIAMALAQKNRVFYINSLGLRKPQVSTGDVGRIYTKLSKFFRGAQHVAKNIWVLTPAVLPFHDSAIVQKINSVLLTRYIQYYILKFDMKRLIFWSFLPNTVNLVGKFNATKSIYYCVDEYSQFEGVPAAAIRQQERQIIKQVDFVFVTAKTLYESKQAGNPNTFYMPHGVDLSHFNQALESNLSIPDDIRKIPAPIIGFYGLIESWLDFELITFLARKRPGWSFVFIGESKVETRRFNHIKNIHFLGKKSYDELPAYNKAFNVAIIPFILNELTRNVNPIKLREYLAAGSPVVSSRLPEIERYQKAVYIADNKQDFLRKLEVAVAEQGPISRKERLDFVKNESWQSRLEQISEIIQSGK